MNTKIIQESLKLDLYGFGGTAVGDDYAGAGFKLMDKMWQVVKSNGLKNKGLNVWVYEAGNKMFAGVELDETPGSELVLERKSVHITKYAYYKHIGPYSKIRQACESMRKELALNDSEIIFPYIEIYGHWTNDQTLLETELIMCLKN